MKGKRQHRYSASFCEQICDVLPGTSLATVREVSATGKLCLMGMDLQGVRELQRNERVDGLYIYLAPPSIQVLEERLRGRRMEAKSTIQKRLQWGEKEVKSASLKQLYMYYLDGVWTPLRHRK